MFECSLIKRFDYCYSHRQLLKHIIQIFHLNKNKISLNIIQNKCKVTLVVLPFSSGFNLLIIILSFTFNKNLPPPPPINSKSSLKTLPHLPSDTRVCCMGAKICMPVNGFPVRAEMCVCVPLVSFPNTSQCIQYS